MSDVKHAAGPWEVTDQNGDPEGSFRGVRRPTQINSLGKPYNMYVAQYCSPIDARLIAAAPDLLEALKALDEAFVSRHGCFPLDEVTPEQRKWKQAMRKARAAVAKASGETP